MEENKGFLRMGIFALAITLAGVLVYLDRQSEKKVKEEETVMTEMNIEEEDENKQSFEEYLNKGGEEVPEKGSFEEYLNNGDDSNKVHNITSEEALGLKKINLSKYVKSITKIKEYAILEDIDNMQKSIDSAVRDGEKIMDNIKILKSDAISEEFKNCIEEYENNLSEVVNNVNAMKNKNCKENEDLSRDIVGYLNELNEEIKQLSKKK